MTDWPVKTLGEVCDLVGGGTPSKDRHEFYGGNIPWATVRDLNVEILRTTEHSITMEAVKSSSSNIIPAGSVVIATRVGLGKAVIVAQDTAINQDLRGLVVKNPHEVLADYLFWWYLSAVHLVIAAGTGATVQGVKLPFVSGLTIPVPPLEEQKRIVELLDAATVHVNELVACYEQARTHANNLFTSVLREALESNPDWPVKTLGEVARWGSGGTPQSGVATYYGGDIPWCVIGDLTEGDVWLTQKSITEAGLLNSSAKIVDVGAVLIAMYGASIGRTGVVRTRMATNQAIAFAYANQEIVHSDFLLMFLQSQKQRFIDAGQGAAQPNISQLVLKEWPISLPPLAEQKKIVVRLDSMRSKTSEMVSLYNAKLIAASNLRQSILEAAFAGEL